MLSLILRGWRVVSQIIATMSHVAAATIRDAWRGPPPAERDAVRPHEPTQMRTLRSDMLGPAAGCGQQHVGLSSEGHAHDALGASEARQRWWCWKIRDSSQDIFYRKHVMIRTCDRHLNIEEILSFGKPGTEIIKLLSGVDSVCAESLNQASQPRRR